MSRQEIIDQQFINIPLTAANIDIYYVRKSILQAIQQSMPQFHGKLLDVGCGIMPYREMIISQADIVSYTGLDFENSVDPQYALGKPDLFWAGDVIPMEDNSVETVLATELLEHCPDPEKVMKEMLRVLKPGGMLFLTVPFLWNLHVVPYDEYRYTPFSLERHLVNAGFGNVQLSALGGCDASMAQMIGIWVIQRPMRPLFKKTIGWLMLPVMRKLIRLDKRYDKTKLFVGGSMITGITGIAFKSEAHIIK
ncbi:MAG: class I SAM-dependent methyltransferase [Ferruginibacter sp.]